MAKILSDKNDGRKSETTTATTTLTPRRICGDGGNVLDTANAHASTSKSTESALCTRAGCLGTSAADCAELDVKGVNAHFLAAFSDVLGSKHGRVGGRFVTIGLYLHAASDSGDCFLARGIGDMDERIVEGGIDVRDAEDDLALRNLGTELDQLFLRDFGLLWWHFTST